MSQGSDAEDQQDHIMDTFPENRMFYNRPQAQSGSRLGAVNSGRDGHYSLDIVDDSRLGTFHPPHNHSVDPAVLHGQGSYPSSAGASDHPQRLDGFTAVPDTPHRSHPNAGFFAGQVEGSTVLGHGLNAHLPDQHNFRRLAPTFYSSSSYIERRRPSARPGGDASSSAADRSDPHSTSYFPSSAGVQGGQHNAIPGSHDLHSRRGRRTGQQSSAGSNSPSTSTRSRYRPYTAPAVSTEAGHAQSSLASLASPQPLGLQSTIPQDVNRKLPLQGATRRSDLLRSQHWFKEQAEEPPITATDEFLVQGYISETDKTRFKAFVGINLATRGAFCRIPHDEVSLNGDTVPCTYEKANEKEALAHVALYFGYAGYKCQNVDPEHQCDKGFPTRQRRNDHYSKANKRPDTRVVCSTCSRSTLERNMERHKNRHKIKCRATIATTL